MHATYRPISQPPFFLLFLLLEKYTNKTHSTPSFRRERKDEAVAPVGRDG